MERKMKDGGNSLLRAAEANQLPAPMLRNTTAHRVCVCPPAISFIKTRLLNRHKSVVIQHVSREERRASDSRVEKRAFDR